MAEEDSDFLSLSDLESELDSISIPMFFDKNRHICYLEMMLELLPSPYQSQEINRLTLAYFVVCGLDILRSLDRVRISPDLSVHRRLDINNVFSALREVKIFIFLSICS